MDKINSSEHSKCNMIKGSDIMSNLNICLLFSEERIQWGSPREPDDYDSIPMKKLEMLSGRE